MTYIRDPDNNHGAGVTSKGQLKTYGISDSPERNANVTEGKAWNIVLQQTPTGGNDNFFYFKNTGTETYVIESIDYRTASAESFLVYLNTTGTPSGGTTATPVASKTNSAFTPTATIEAGNNITGLTDGSLHNRVYMTSTATTNYNFDQDIVVAPGGVVTFQAVTGGILIDMNIMIHEVVVS